MFEPTEDWPNTVVFEKDLLMGKEDHKKLHMLEMVSHNETKVLLANQARFMERMRDQIAGYGPELKYLREKVNELRKVCEGLGEDLERERRKHEDSLEVFKKEAFQIESKS